MPSAPNCNQPEALFFDDKPLVRAASLTTLANGAFYLDYARGLIVVADDPAGRKVELTVGFFAFESFARDVWISNVIVEKYASVAQKGAVHAREGAGWHIEDCEVRLNSGSGIDVGTGSVVRNCDIHHNGQIGIVSNGKGIQIEDNHIWSNNTKGFDPAWEATAHSSLADVAPDPSIDHGNTPVLDRLVGERTALINQLRAVLLERGIVVPQGRRKL